MKYSVIDVSSSSISMIVAENGGVNEVVSRERASLSLIHYLEGDSLSRRGIVKLAALLNHMKALAAAQGAERCYVISTAALRHVANSGEIAAFVRETTGLAINFIDEPTEAYCDYIANLSYRTCERPVLIDLGGKSIEVCDLAKTEKAEMFGMEFGLTDLTRKFVSNIYPDEEEVKAIRKFLKKKFDGAGLPEKGTFETAVLVGAASTALYDIYADFAKVSGAEEKTVDVKKYKKLVKRLLEGADRSRLILKNAPEKMYLICAAAVTLKVLFKRFGIRTVIVSDSGVKEGYLRLVLEGREKGEYLALTPPAPAEESGAGSAEEPVEVPVDVSAVSESEAEQERPASKKRGRPAGSANKKPAVQPSSAAAEQEKPAPARRGRPKKAAAGQPSEQEKPAPKKRGRPAGSANKKPAVQPSPAAADKEDPAPARQGQAKRHGRPKKTTE